MGRPVDENGWLVDEELMEHTKRKSSECCETGDQFIRWMTAKEADDNVDGWYLPIHIGYPDANYELVVVCPFCGGILPQDKPESRREAWARLRDAETRYRDAVERDKPLE